MENKISLCPSCNCMTHTVDGQCAWCWGSKNQDHFVDANKKVEQHWRDVACHNTGPCNFGGENGCDDCLLEMAIHSEIAAAEERGREEYLQAIAYLRNTPAFKSAAMALEQGRHKP